MIIQPFQGKRRGTQPIGSGAICYEGGCVIYGVYLVNYERVEINDITKMLSRSKKGFEVIGHSIDGDTAINEILLLKPDLVITELYLRTMTGNALIHRIRHAGIVCEFIILTDTYAHRALVDFYTSGGFDYWLKSRDTADKECMLEKLACKLNKQKRG
jgi:YesN/AraC family two-component response regulator